MKTQEFREFRVYYYSENVFQCFAQHSGDAVEQLMKLYEGLSFTELNIRGIRSAMPEGWQDEKMPIFKAIK